MMFVSGPVSFCALRFLLGVAEAGFFPGIIFYLSEWFPSEARARAVARFMTAIPVSGAIGGPVLGALLGLNGWQTVSNRSFWMSRAIQVRPTTHRTESEPQFNGISSIDS